MSFFDDAFLADVSADPILSTRLAVSRVTAAIQFETGEGWTTREHELLLETYALITAIIEADLLPDEVPDAPVLTHEDYTEDCKELWRWLQSVDESLQKVTSLRNFLIVKSKFSASIRRGFSYEFSKGDFDRIQALLNDLRTLIADAPFFEETHRARLLKRLESLQSEMHKKMSDLDKFWGLVGDAGTAIGKFGESAKPIVDRVREIVDIVWNTQARAEDLPSGTRPPLIEPPSGDLDV